MRYQDLIAFAQRHRLSDDAQRELFDIVDAMPPFDPAAEAPPTEALGAPPLLVSARDIETQPTIAPETAPELLARLAPAKEAEGEGETTVQYRARVVSRETPILHPRRRQPRARVLDLEGRRLGARYEDLGPLGIGGMGEVRQVLDRDLGRIVAMKLVKADLLGHPSLIERFVEEAQACSQLQHPGIIPLYDLGRLPDGRWYFTMQQIRGRTLTAILREVHEASRPLGRWQQTTSGWTFRKLIAAFRRVCEAVGYAHGRGVVHRDLKPDNIMLGDTGEVLVVDWGIAKILGRDVDPVAPVITDRSQDREHATQFGVVTGTPAYMPPEQAHGEHSLIDSRSDVYALGAILYELLTGRAPYLGSNAVAVLLQVGQGPPTPLSSFDALPLAEELVEACERAMERERSDRFVDAAALATAVGEWLEGLRKRQRGLELVAQAEALEGGARARRAQRDALRVQATALLDAVPLWASEERKRESWLRGDLAVMFEREEALQHSGAQQRLQAALTYAPNLPEAHAALAKRHEREHRDAEILHDETAAEDAEARLRDSVERLPAESPERRRHLAYLEGLGALSLRTEPPNARVRLHRYEPQHRRLVAVFERDLGVTPLEEVSLRHGSYLLEIEGEGREVVRYPVLIERLGSWDTTPPGGSEPLPIQLPARGALAQEEVYIPAGWFFAGEATARRRFWLDAFVMSRFPVTHRAYLAFLNELCADDGHELAARVSPKRPSPHPDRDGDPLYTRTPDGGFALPSDGAWGLDDPVVAIDWRSAQAFCRWRAADSGLEWRLPTELEWEKAARGADARPFPWGAHLDPSWCCMRDSHLWRYGPAPSDSFPVDESPWGARGLAGNVSDWCLDVLSRSMGAAPNPSGSASSHRRVVRGGSWAGGAGDCLVTHRGSAWPASRHYTVGLRPVRSWPKP